MGKVIDFASARTAIIEHRNATSNPLFLGFSLAFGIYFFWISLVGLSRH